MKFTKSTAISLFVISTKSITSSVVFGDVPGSPPQNNPRVGDEKELLPCIWEQLNHQNHSNYQWSIFMNSILFKVCIWICIPPKDIPLVDLTAPLFLSY